MEDWNWITRKDVPHVDNTAFHGSTNFNTTFSKLLGFSLYFIP